MNIKKFTLATFTKAALLTLISIHAIGPATTTAMVTQLSERKDYVLIVYLKLRLTIAGTFILQDMHLPIGGQPDYFVIKRDAQGDTLWFYYYDSGFRGEDYVRDLAVDNSGNVFITGELIVLLQGTDAVTIKLNSSGVQQWIARYPSPTAGETFANSIAVDATGMCISQDNIAHQAEVMIGLW